MLLADYVPPDANDAVAQQDQLQPAEPEPITEESCILGVLSIIPDVCTDHVRTLFNQNQILQGNHIIQHIIHELLDNGANYPRREPEKEKALKRKRSLEEAVDEYEAANREAPPYDYFDLSRKLLQQEFPLFPASNIDKVLKRSVYLAPAYAMLFSLQDTYDKSKRLPFALLKRLRPADVGNEREKMSKTYHDLIVELEYARHKAKTQMRDAQLQADAELAATLDLEEHEENGMMMDQCCFGEYAFSNMTQCGDGHLFCLDCAKRNAENEVGRGRYQLLCMAGCKNEFPRREILRFLEPNLMAALEKNEQEEALRMANLHDLTKCPFCNYAAICVPIEQDKEFRCGNQECGEVSCRHCQLKTHIPRSCEEVAKENKLSIRHQVEEAMTEALVRTCTKCSNKFIKEYGCNKMTCSRCHTLHCYVCGQAIKGYGHFNDPSRGGKAENTCPLFDNTDERHNDDVQKAALAAIDKIIAENPDISKEDLEVKVSNSVQKTIKPSVPAQRVPAAPPAAPVQHVPAAPVQNVPAAAVHRAPAAPVRHDPAPFPLLQILQNGMPAAGHVFANPFPQHPHYHIIPPNPGPGVFAPGAQINPYQPQLVPLANNVENQQINIPNGAEPAGPNPFRFQAPAALGPAMANYLLNHQQFHERVQAQVAQARATAALAAEIKPPTKSSARSFFSRGKK
ncbi:hypothetical protein DFH27DRAFT_479993 [Peziza echinospora]|nr:hypothetical protein DFH27DRAFT_479993 [Peziza echinospora]